MAHPILFAGFKLHKMAGLTSFLPGTVFASEGNDSK
jgi:hypothetical protein